MVEEEALSPPTDGGSFFLSSMEGAKIWLDWGANSMLKEMDWSDSSFFALLDERSFLEVALLSSIVSLMAFLEGIMMTEEIESFHKYHERRDRRYSFR